MSSQSKQIRFFFLLNNKIGFDQNRFHSSQKKNKGIFSVYIRKQFAFIPFESGKLHFNIWRIFVDELIKMPNARWVTNHEKHAVVHSPVCSLSIYYYIYYYWPTNWVYGFGFHRIACNQEHKLILWHQMKGNSHHHGSFEMTAQLMLMNVLFHLV